MTAPSHRRQHWARASPWLAALVLLGCGAPSSDTAEPEAIADATAEAGPPAWLLAAVAQPRGVLENEPSATAGYVLYSSLLGSSAFLIDQQGKLVHQWRNELAAGVNYLMDNGDLLRCARMAEPPNFKTGGVGGYLQRLSWDGEVLWQWQMADTERILHHDIAPMPNGNILAIAFELKTRDEAIAAGRDAHLVPEAGLWSEWLLEIEPIPPDDARVVWEWRIWDHLVQNRDPQKPNYGELSDHPRRLDINAGSDAPEVDEEELEQLKAVGYVPDDATVEDLQSDFLHMNSVDYNAELDQIAVSLPEIGELWILDHSTTTDEARGGSGGRYGHGGDALYRWGNPAVYGRGTKSDQRLFYQHQVEWVPNGFPGAGNLLMFNNGAGRPGGDHSSIEEITPPIGSDGSYELPGDGPFGPTEPSWRYTAAEESRFFAPFISGVQRLENGNTFVCEGPQGHFFEVTPAGEVVWRFRNPFYELVPGWNPPGTEEDVPYGVFRATKIPPDHPALQNRDLEPLEPQPEWYVPPPRESGAPSAP